MTALLCARILSAVGASIARALLDIFHECVGRKQVTGVLPESEKKKKCNLKKRTVNTKKRTVNTKRELK